MKTMILIYLAGQLLRVSAPQAVAAPDAAGMLAQFYGGQTTFVYAHSYLSGTLFYDLDEGETVTAYYSDGSHADFEVTDIGAYTARSTTIAAGGGDFKLDVDDQWVKITDVMKMYAAPGGITFATCYAVDKGLGVVTGRLFVETRPVAEDVR